MTHKAPRNLHICVGCIVGFHHVGEVRKTEQGRPCNCVCQEQDFSIFCAAIRGALSNPKNHQLGGAA